MVYRAIEIELGDYIKDNVRYEILEVINCISLEGENVGWVECANIEEFAEQNGFIYNPLPREIIEKMINNI